MMIKKLMKATLMVAAIAVAMTGTAANTPDRITPDFVEAAEASVNAVVHIKTTIVRKTATYNDFFGAFLEHLYGIPGQTQNNTMVAYGSGVVLSPDGYIVTIYRLIHTSVLQRPQKMVHLIVYDQGIYAVPVDPFIADHLQGILKTEKESGFLLVYAGGEIFGHPGHRLQLLAAVDQLRGLHPQPLLPVGLEVCPHPLL